MSARCAGLWCTEMCSEFEDFVLVLDGRPSSCSKSVEQTFDHSLVTLGTISALLLHTERLLCAVTNMMPWCLDAASDVGEVCRARRFVVR